MGKASAQIMQRLFDQFDASIAGTGVSPGEALAALIVHKSLEGSVDPEALFKRVSTLGREVVAAGLRKR